MSDSKTCQSNPKKSKRDDSEEETFAKKIKMKNVQVVSINNLRDTHSDSNAHCIQVKCVTKEPIKNIFSSKKSQNLQLFNATFCDKQGSLIKFQCWNDVALYFFDLFRLGAFYEFSNMKIEKASAYDLKSSPNMHYVMKGHKDMSVSDKVEYENFKTPEVKYFDSIDKLKEFEQEFSRQEIKSNVVNVIGKIIEHGPKREGVSKAGKSYCLSKLVVGDQSMHCIETTLWGEEANKVRYPMGSLVSVQGAKVVLKDGNLELQYPSNIELITSGSSSKIEEMLQWATTTNHLDVSEFKNVSNAVPYGSKDGVVDGNVPYVTTQELLYWQKQARNKIKQWEECGLIVNNDKTSKKEFTAEQKKELANGTFYLIGEVTSVMDTAIKNAKIGNYAQTILNPACENKEFHKDLKIRVNFVSGMWVCDKCKNSSETCTYGVLANIDFTDIHTVTLRSYTLQNLLPEGLTPEMILKEECGDNLPNPDDHLIKNSVLVKALDHLITRKCKIICATIKVEPDFYNGLQFVVKYFTTPKLDQESENLTKLLE